MGLQRTSVPQQLGTLWVGDWVVEWVVDSGVLGMVSWWCGVAHPLVFGKGSGVGVALLVFQRGRCGGHGMDLL